MPQRISSARAIPGSSWILVAKVDQAEVYAPIRADAARAVLIVVALLALVAWDEAPVVEVEVDESRGTLPPDAY